MTFTRSALLAGLLVAVGLAGQPCQGRTPVRSFSGQALQQIAFPLGGIGTGSVSLGGRGELRDWEIFGKPAKGSSLDFTFFALWARRSGKEPVARVLERRYLPPYRDGGFGLPQKQLAGLPRLAEAVFLGEYPFARISFKDPDLPVRVQLEAWSPFIPLDVPNSALPAAVFSWKITNPNRDSVEVSLAACISNPIGDRYANAKGEKPGLGRNLNAFVDAGDLRGIRLSSEKIPAGDPGFGTIALATTHRTVDVQTRWYRGGWWDPCHIFWDDFAADGRLREVRDTSASEPNSSDVGTVVLRARIGPGQTVILPVLLTWHFPNRENYWNHEPVRRGAVMKNYVAGRFADAWDVATYVVKNFVHLEAETRAFHDALFATTAPAAVLDAVSSQISTLKTTVCMMLEDGSFFGFEGVGDDAGCCWLNCTHVWNYEQALAYLFPPLERSMRETDFLHNTLPSGYMTFRTLLPLSEQQWQFKPCADGQMGDVVRAYREWKLSGDSGWLRKIWPGVKRALEFAWKGTGDTTGYGWTRAQIPVAWDPNRDGVMEGEQHNTYDIEFYGPNTLTGSLYLAALRAGALMAEAMGEPQSAAEYRQIFNEGSRRYDAMLWNGRYYRQDVSVYPGITIPERLVSPPAASCDSGCACKPAAGRALEAGRPMPKYQYGSGCLADQLLGQYLADVTGLGSVLNRDHVRQALGTIFRENFKANVARFSNVQRVYALNDDAGLLLCTWPDGDRPALPFPYSDEVWTGIEYQVAASLIYSGLTDEGLKVVSAVRARYDGLRRNPWDEEECGHHYARAMSSWALLLALSGYHYDGVAQEMSFAPAVQGGAFSSFWSCGSAWGTVHIDARGGRRVVELRTLHGAVALSALGAPGTGGATARAALDGKRVDVQPGAGAGEGPVRFRQPVTIGQGSVLTLRY